MTPGSVLLVEDHQLLAQTLAAALGARGLRVAVAPSTDEATVVRLAHKGTVAVLDLQLAHDQDGSLLVEPLRRVGATVLVVTGSRDLMAIGRALDDGAVEVVDKSAGFDHVLAAVTAALAGTGPVDPTGLAELWHAVRAWRSDRAEAAAVLDRLTPREAEVLDDLCRGVTAEDIARTARVSLTTVRSQVAAILTKLGVHSQLTAVARAGELRARVASRGEPHHPAAER